MILKEFDTLSLRKSVTLSIAITISILIISILSVTNYVNNYYAINDEKEHNSQVQKSIELAISHHVKKYKHIAKRMIMTTDLPELLKKEDRKSIYNIFKTKWDLMVEEDPSLLVMHFHHKDGSSFLRMHKPESFGDNLTRIRPMIKLIHESQKSITGFETGRLGSVYRVITPIFDEKQTYLGALEFGLRLNFIMHKLYEVNGLEGLVFIKDDKLTFFGEKDYLIIDGYKLLSKPTGKILAIAKAIKTLNNNESNIILNVEKKKYKTHVYPLTDFNNQPTAKIFVFHKIMQDTLLDEHLLLVLQSALILLSIIILIWFIYKKIGKYESYVSHLYKKQIQQIQESEKKFYSIFNDSSDGIVLADVDTKNLLTANKRFCSMLRYELADIEKLNVMDILPKVGLERTLKHFERQLKGEIFTATDIPIKRKDSSIFYTDINSSLINISSKAYILGMFRDITENKTLRNELIFNRNYLQSIFDMVPSIMIVTDGSEITRANRAMLDFTGFETIELFKEEHACICDFFIEDNACLMPITNCVPWLDYILSKPNDIHEVTMIKDDKQHRFIVQATLLNLDEVRHAVATFTDITEVEDIKDKLNNKNKTLLENESKLRAITDSALDAIIILDHKGRFVYWNPRAKEMLGYDEEELIGKDFHKTVAPKAFQGAAEQGYKKFETTGKGEAIGKILERFAIKKGGHEFPISLSLSAVQIDGKWHGVGFMRDITQDKELENELKQKDKIMIAQSRQAAMGDMISMIAHQWRQPITAIGMGAQNMQIDIELEDINPEKFDDKLSKIVEQTQFLSKTIDDFRNFLKPNKTLDRVMISEVVESSLAIIEKSLENNNILINKDFQRDIKFTTYCNEIIQVLLNIIGNAKDAIIISKIDDGVIEIETDYDEKNIYFKICDNAGGVPEDIIHKIFEPYYTTKDEKTGTGLGLYMSQMIIEKHLGGKITVVNSGKGACFTISLPLENNDGD